MLGLLVRSEIELPELPEAPSSDATPDILIRRGVVPANPGRPRSDEDFPPYRVGDGGFSLEREGVARFLAVGGRDVVVDACRDASEVDVRVFLLGSVLGALCHQRGLIPLHAAAVADGGQAYAFSGPSGTGKSTISAGLRQQGFAFVADDICPIILRDEGQPEVLGSVRKVKLAADTLRALGHGSEGQVHDHRVVPKYHVPVAEDAVSPPVPLRAVYMFRHDNDATGDSRIEEISPPYAVRCFEQLTYMPRYPHAAGRAEEHFLRCAALAARVPLFLVHHRPGLERLQSLLQFLSDHIREHASTVR
jgi:hypothetical protein